MTQKGALTPSPSPACGRGATGRSGEGPEAAWRAKSMTHQQEISLAFPFGRVILSEAKNLRDWHAGRRAGDRKPALSEIEGVAPTTRSARKANR